MDHNADVPDMRAANAIYDVPEGRPAWKTLPIRVGVTLALIVCLNPWNVGLGTNTRP